MSEIIPVTFAPKVAIVEIVAPRGVGNGGSGIAAFDHIQLVPATVWTLAHNLGHRPSVTTLSVGGQEIEGEVLHLSKDVVTVTFLLPVAGSAHLV